ncbi:ubiquitin-like small modifier protein 1 [Methanohalobium sp.]|uniref:ubiquitin-like small modifier protein 1 n=1 Tax=Methanohalobium sp. TaxID=2837493 RepID=UPI0025E18D09|nr:ubiquitin-like small modifier protein 1 [Methanohalobium sp.]
MVEIKFFSVLNDVTKTRSTIISADNIELSELFNKLIEIFGKDLKNRLFQNGELRTFINVYVNGEDVKHLKGLKTKIRDSDEISILPAISGG